MYCENCGKKLNENQRFCPDCGTKKRVDEAKNEKTPTKKTKQAKCWSIFARVGFGLGLAGFITSWIIIGYVLGVNGIVFSALGMHSNTNHGTAVAGLVLSILGTILGLAFYVIWIVALA